MRTRGRAATIITTAAAGVALAQLARAARGVPSSKGAKPHQIRDTALRSPHFDGTTFHNTLPSTVMSPGSTKTVVRGAAAARHAGRPAGPIPLETPEIPDVAADLAATWLGHASVLLEIDGYRVLADPVFGDRVSPSAQVGPRRLHASPLTVDQLPKIDAVVISHDHYDHLDVPSIRALTDTQNAMFLVPLGIGAHLRVWGVPENRIIELDWNESAQVGDLTITCTEARHFSGRWLTRNTTLWSSWAIAGPKHRVFFGGDTGYTPAFAGIGARYGSFDLTVLPIGAYGDAWPDIHMNPEEALRAHGDLGGTVLLPIHWATFNLAFHSWAEPIERLLSAASSETQIALPKPGERFTPSAIPGERWWDAVVGAQPAV